VASSFSLCARAPLIFFNFASAMKNLNRWRRPHHSPAYAVPGIKLCFSMNHRIVPLMNAFATPKPPMRTKSGGHVICLAKSRRSAAHPRFCRLDRNFLDTKQASAHRGKPAF
jgi:hypothetical protein